MNKQCPLCGRCMAFPEKPICTICEWDRETRSKGRTVPYAKETVMLNGTFKTSQARINELESRVMLPYDRKDGEDYYVGTRTKSGKILEKEPDFRP